MKRFVRGLSLATTEIQGGLPDVFLARIERVQYRWHKTKPHYVVLFNVLEPKSLTGNRFSARLGCTGRALWRLHWFLSDFGYDKELLCRNEIDDGQLIGLSGVVRVRQTLVNGASLLSDDGFAPQQQWKQLSGEVNVANRKRAKS